MTVNEFCKLTARYLGGTEYGHPGNAPIHPDMNSRLQEELARCVAYGRLSGQKMNDGLFQMARDYRHYWYSNMNAKRRDVGGGEDQWEEAFWIGYLHVRPGFENEKLLNWK